MKKITLLCLATLFYTFSYAQVLNQPANWPNVNWSVVGVYNAAALEADPTLTANFAFNDDLAGNGSADDIATESPTIDISAAFAASETWIIVNLNYTYNDLAGTLNLEYWDADAAAWVVWQQFVGTADQPNNNFCGGTRDAFMSNPLDISGFTATQQSGFQYRLSFDDAGGWQWGFCFDSPTIISEAPPTCFDISNLASANVTDVAVDISWDANNGETAWEVAIQNAGTGVPTAPGTPVTTNAPYAASGLNPSTNYEVYVRANCGVVDGFSNWVGPINFLTLNAPPPPPVGVTCVTAGLYTSLIQDFEIDPPFGWTGTGFDGTNGNWDITAGNANSFDTGPATSLSGGFHLEYEASGNSTDIATAISPAIDLTGALDGAELTFFMHAFGADIGILNVNVGTSPTGPFTNLFSWNGDIQVADTDPWTPIGINLDAYLGQTIYVEFSYGGAGGGFEGDMSIDLVEVKTCSNNPPSCVSIINPGDGDTAIDILGGVINWSAATGDPAGYILFVGTTPGGTDLVNGDDVGNVTTYTLGDLVYDTTYYITILGYNGNGLASGCTEQSFTTRPDPNQVFNIVCANGPINLNHCYTDNDDNTFLFTSDSGFPMELVFNSGTILDDDDIIIVYDGSDNTFPVLFTGNNGGDLGGLTITSGLGNLYMEVVSDAGTSCATGTGVPWDWTVRCLTCFGPTATYTIVEDCSMGDQFLVDVEILNTGDALSITITDDFGSAPQVVSVAGVYTFGPYPNATEVIFTVADTDDTNCVLTSTPQTQAFCPDQACGIINAGYDQVQLCDETSTDLSATFMTSAITSNTSSYTISDLQCPPENLTGVPTSITLDDRWSSVINLGFNFDYFGNSYTDVIIGANGLLSFQTGDAGTFNEWNINAADLIPSPNLPLNAIHGAYHDIDPGVPGDHYIEYTTVGTAPARQFKITFFEVPHFQCNDLMTTQQIILYESSNVVDVIILEKPICNTWNGGLATLGIQNDTGTVGYAPPGRNTGVWAATQQELWRFVPDGNPNYTFEWLDQDGNVISNNTDITVSPTVDTTYTASITYALADGSLVVLTDDVLVTVQQDPEIIATQTLEVCDDNIDGFAEFDLTLEDPFVIGVQPNVTATYYETLADAEAGTGMITSATAYTNTTANLQTIYVRVEDDTTGCYITGNFDLVVLPKDLLGPIANLEVCDDDTDGFVEFNLSTQDAGIIGTQTGMTVSYHETQADADAGTSAITNTTAYANTTANMQTIYVRIENNTTNCYQTGTFDLIVIPNPIVASVIDLEICDDDFDGFAEFDLTLQDANVIGTQTNVIVTYYETQADAQAGVNILADPTMYINTTPDSEIVYVRIENNDALGCFATGSFNVIALPQIDPNDIDIEGECINEDFTITVSPVNGSYDPNTVTYEWSGGTSANNTDSQFIATDDGEYTVLITNADGCVTMKSFSVVNSMCSFPKGISPNGDGLNDNWNLAAFRVQEVEIFNSHGRSLYKKRNYVDEWYGQTNDNDNLPVGTYFYVLKLENGQSKNGWIYLNK